MIAMPASNCKTADRILEPSRSLGSLARRRLQWNSLNLELGSFLAALHESPDDPTRRPVGYRHVSAGARGVQRYAHLDADPFRRPSAPRPWTM
jgi:hypothetical protein